MSWQRQLDELLDAARIFSPHSFALGQDPPIDVSAAVGRSPAVPATPPWTDDPLVRALTLALYDRGYARQLRSAAAAGLPPDASPDPRFAAQLSEANRSRPRWDAAWSVYRVEPGGQIHAQKGDRCRTAEPASYRLSSGQHWPEAGRLVALEVPRESLLQSQCAYVALGETLGDQLEPTTTLRFYFHTPAELAPQIVTSLTARLNQYQLPFRLKCFVDPQQYQRSDACVLYVPRRYYTIAAHVVSQLPAGLLAGLRPAVPLLCKPLRAGVGLAEDPGNGESFGLHRMRLVAEALVAAWRSGKQDLAARREAVRARFAGEGLVWERPWLEPGSVDFPELHIQVPATHRDDAESHSAVGDARLVDAAARMGNRLCRDAIWAGGRCAWLGWQRENGRDSMPATYGSQGWDLYAGSAGVALLLSQLYRFTRDPLHAQTLQGAARHAAQAADRSAQRRCDFFRGAGGVVYALVETSHALESEQYLQSAAELLARLAAALEADPSSSAESIADGVFLLLHCGQRLGREDLLKTAHCLGERLVARSPAVDPGWPPAQRKVACVLLELHRFERDERFRAAALRLLAAEQGASAAEHPGRLPGECDGAAGRGVLQLRLCQLLDRPAELAARLESSLQATAWALAQQTVAQDADAALCRGRTGHADFLLLASDVLGRPQLRAPAEALAAAVLALDERGNAEADRAPPGLMRGAAGVGYFLLRLYDSKSVPSVLAMPAASGTW